MAPEREMAVRAMQNLGWTAKKNTDGKHPRWEFSRPDTGGLWDVCKCPQSSLSMMFVVDMALAYGDAPMLADHIKSAKEEWLRVRFLGLAGGRHD